MKSEGSSSTKEKDEHNEPVNGTMQPVSMERLAVTDEEEQHEMDKKHRQCLSERKRKDKIKSGIQKIGQLLPLSYRSEKESATFLLEQASVYIKDLQKQVDRFLLEDGDQVKADEIRRLREENDGLRQDIASLKDILQNGAFQSLGCNKSHESLSSGDFGINQSPSSSASLTSPTESTSSKRKNLVSQHLEGRKAPCSEESHLTLNGVSQNPILVSPDAGMANASSGNMSFMNQMFLSPSSMGGVMNCSTGSLLDESSVHNRTGNGALVVEPESVQQMQETGPLPNSTSSQFQCISSAASIMATSQLQQPALTVSTNSYSHPVLSQQVMGAPQMGNTFSAQPPGAMNPTGSGQLQGTLVIHNGQLLLVNPQLQSNGPVQHGQGQLKSLPSLDKVGNAGLVVSGAQGPLMATSTGQPVIPQNTLLTTTHMVTHTTNQALMTGPAGQVTSQMTTRPPMNLNMNMPAMRAAMGPALIPNCAQDPSHMMNTQQGLAGLQAPHMLNQHTVTVQPPHSNQQSNLPSALLLPNGQIVPVVTQPNLMVPAPAAPQQLAAGAGLVASANSPVRLPVMGPHSHAMLNTTGLQLPGMAPQSLRMSASSVSATTATHTPVLSAGTMRLYTPGTSTIHHVPSSTGLASSQPLAMSQNTKLGSLPRASSALSVNPPVSIPIGVTPQPQTGNVNQPLCVGTPGTHITNASCVAKGPGPSVPSTSSSMSAGNLPATVAAVLTPEGNIILTFTQAGGGPSSATQQQLQQQQQQLLGKKGGPRTLMPKPINTVSRASTPVDIGCSKAVSVAESSVTEKAAPAEEGITSVPPATPTVPSTSVSSMTPLSISITTTTTSSGLSSSTDILAKAAESIFASASPSDMSPSMPGFYNSVHDDNPLHIDTGTGENEALKEAVAVSQAPVEPQAASKNKAKTKASKSSKPKPKSNKKKKNNEPSAETSSENVSQELSVDTTGFCSMSSSEGTGFMDHIPGGGEKLEEEEESDINDFSDLIKLHEPEMLVKANCQAKEQAQETKEETNPSQSLALSTTNVSVCSSVAEQSDCISSRLMQNPSISVPQSITDTSTSTISSSPCVFSQSTVINQTVSAPAPLLSMPVISSMDSHEPFTTPPSSMNCVSVVSSGSRVVVSSASVMQPVSNPATSVNSQFVLPPALQASYIALPPVSHTQKEKHKKHKHKKKDRSEGSSKSKKKSKEDKKLCHPDLPPVLDSQAPPHQTFPVNPHDFPPDLSKDPPLRTSTPPPHLVSIPPIATVETHKSSKSKKSKSKSKSKKKKHKEHDMNESMLSSTECESTLTTSALDSSTDSQKEQVLMEIQNELAAQISHTSEPEVSVEEKRLEQVAMDDEAARLFWEKEIAQKNVTSKGKEENTIVRLDDNSTMDKETVDGDKKSSSKKSRKNTKPKKKSSQILDNASSTNVSIPSDLVPEISQASTVKQLSDILPILPTESTISKSALVLPNEIGVAPGSTDSPNKDVSESDTNQTSRKRKAAGSNHKKKSKVRPEDIIPEQITFSENDLADVLNQVESYGETLVQETSSKKQRSKKNKPVDSTEDICPPPSKKRKGKDGVENEELEAKFSSAQDEQRIRNEPPPPALAGGRASDNRKPEVLDVFAFTEEDEEGKTSEKAKHTLSKSRKRGGKSKMTDNGSEPLSVGVSDAGHSSPHVSKTSKNSIVSPAAPSPHPVKPQVSEDASSAIKSPERSSLPISSPPPLITDCSQTSAPSPSQVAKNLFDLPNLMTPSVPIPIEDVDRGSSRDDGIMEDYEIAVPGKNSSSNDNAMNEAIDSLCRILPSPGKERDVDGDGNRSKPAVLSLDLDEPPPTPGQARHNNLVSLAGHVAPPRKSSASAKSKSSSSKVIAKPPLLHEPPAQSGISKPEEAPAVMAKPATPKESLTHVKEVHSDVSGPKKSPAQTAVVPPSDKSPQKNTDSAHNKLPSGGQSKDGNLLEKPPGAVEKVACQQSPKPSSVVQNYPCERSSGYTTALHHSPASNTTPDKSPRPSEHRKTPQQLHPPVDRPTAGVSAPPVPPPPMRPLDHSSAPPLQHENFSSCMAQSAHSQTLRHEKELYSPPPLSTSTSSSSCAVQTGKSPADAFSFSPHYTLTQGSNMVGPVQAPPTMQSYCLPVTSSTNTFSFSLSPSHNVTTTTSSVMSSYDQHLQGGGYGPMYPHPSATAMGPQTIPPHSQGATPQHMPSAPPALGFPAIEPSASSKSGSSCAAVASGNHHPQLHQPVDRPPTAGATTTSGTMRPRRDSQPGASEKHVQSSGRNSQQTSPYGNFMGNSNGSQQQQPKSGVMPSYPENQQTPNTLSRSSKSSSGNRSSSGSVGRSPQMAQPPKETPTQFLSPTGGTYQVTGVGTSSNPLTSPPLHHHGPAVSSHRSSSTSAAAQRSSYSASHYGSFANPGASFGPISAFGAQAFDPPALQFSGMASGRESRAASGSGAPGYGGSSSNSHGNQKQSSSSKPVGGSGLGSSKQSSNSQQQGSQQPHKSSSRSSSKKSKSKQSSSASASVVTNPYEMDTALFDPNRMTPAYFPLAGLSPPPRNLQADGPTYLPNLFNNPSRTGPLSHSSNTLQHKDPSMSHPFMFSHHSRGPQNGIGLNFGQPGFGMNAMHHGNHVSSSQLTPHTNSVSVTPHMPNFNLTNIFTDMNNPAAQAGTDGLNISPIKFAHGNGLLGAQAGMEHNLQHAHQAGAMYHNPRGSQMPPPHMLHNSMNINSLLSHQHAGFEAAARGVAPSISSTMTPPFGGHSHPHSFGMPPLNFPMHDH